ncbi:MtrAB system accessory protein LpqB [Corynebacterium lizhenjunii]|uniref:Lipoprotein LpqB n=1 Tax=Corynebacterium lizhenjunii TaxID=2709394 RepID=A0A7T0KGG4_9CORY|nr:MtrAB system accessory lipoprotein LpqB [Corynebacterium lizhenjunii]QPK79689.1 MtrAB system accessory protein LpqB [Corynebacterium lizhenjunii]
MPKYSSRRLRRIVALLALPAVVAAGCSTLPSNTSPQVLRSYDPAPQVQPMVGPQDGQEPDLLVRDFYRASALPSGDYAAARAFLTPEAAREWDPEAEILLVDAIDLTTRGSASSGDARTLEVRGNVIGTLEEGGSYITQNGGYEASIELAKVDGQWRIKDLPAGVVIERNELRNQYQPENLYFYAGSGQALIADRRWVFAGKDTLDTELITLLMEGPAPSLEPAIRTVLPPGAVFAGVEDGAYRFNGLAGMNEEDRMRFAAQLVWTLTTAGVPAPYEAIADGSPLLPELEEMTPDDFADYNPRASTNTVPGLFALNKGNVLRVTGTHVEPISGPLGDGGNVESAEISAVDKVAAVRSTGERSRLYLGDLSGTPVQAIEAKTLSRPTFERGGEAVWTVVDGQKVNRYVRSATSGQVVETEVDTSALENLSGEISVLRLSVDGARVAMIIDGKIYTGVNVREDNGSRRVVSVREIASELGGMALSLDWQPDGSLVVGTSSPDSPVWRVEQDGSSLTTLPSGNITAPVVSIAANQSTIFATDAHATLQLSSTDATSSFWREVPGLQGMRSAPIVAN